MFAFVCSESRAASAVVGLFVCAVSVAVVVSVLGFAYSVRLAMRRRRLTLKAQRRILFGFPERSFLAILEQVGEAELRKSMLGSDKIMQVGEFFAGMGTMGQALRLIQCVTRKHGYPFQYRRKCCFADSF